MSLLGTPKIHNPTYYLVCRGDSGHIEVLYIELMHPEKQFFFQFHDPTTSHRQGNDCGFQYASWMFCGDQKQIEIAKRVKDELQGLLDLGAIPRNTYAGKSIHTS